jgi:hypothetical protein
LETQEGTTIGKTLTLLLIFVVTIVAVIVVFAYFNGLFGLVSPKTDSMGASGVFGIAGGSGNSGTLVVLVQNTGQASITGVAFACPASQFSSTNCGGMIASLNGIPITTNSPLTHGMTASGSSIVQPGSTNTFIPGTIYKVTVTATFADGGTISQILSLPAQAG